MLLAELELHHSRPVAPTRRLALGRRLLPHDPAPGFGGLLVAAIVARFSPELDHDTRVELVGLIADLEQGRRIAQPRLRFRLQHDRVGLVRSVHRLHGDGETLRLELAEDRGVPAQHVLGAVYAAGELPPAAARSVLGLVRRALSWGGGPDSGLFAHLGGRAPVRGDRDAVDWAREVLGLDAVAGLDRARIQKRFRAAVRDAHPDHGGDDGSAATRLADLAEARRILLAVCGGSRPRRADAAGG